MWYEAYFVVMVLSLTLEDHLIFGDLVKTARFNLNIWFLSNFTKLLKLSGPLPYL